MSDSILVTRNGSTATITLDRAGVHNAFDDVLIADLTQALEDCDGEQPTFDQSETGRLAAVLALARQATQLLLGYPGDDSLPEVARAALGLDSDAVFHRGSGEGWATDGDV